MKRFLNSTLSILLVVLSYNSHAQAENTASTGMLMLQTLLGLLVVIVAIVGFAWLARKIQNQGFGRNNTMSLISVLPLGTREKAVLIKAQGKTILLGVAPGRVSALHVFDESVCEDESPNILANEYDEELHKKPLGSQSSNAITALAAKSTSEFSKKLHSFLGQGQSRL